MKEGIFAHWPNRITAVRFVGSLVLFVLFAVQGEDIAPGPTLTGAIAFWLFVTIAATDFLDGWLARRGNVVTAFGRIADPFVDKVLVIGTMVFLAVLDWSSEWFPAWIVVVVVAREFLVTGIRGEMEDIIEQVSFQGSFAEFLEFLRTDPQFYFKTGEDILREYQVISKRIDPELIKLFGRIPRMPYGVKAIPEAIAPDTTTASPM